MPSDEQFRFSLAQVGELGAYLLGRRLYETMLVWETDPSLRSDEARTAFAGGVVRTSEGRLQPYAHQRRRQRPARRGVGG